MPSITPIGRVSYPNVFQMQEYNGNKAYSITLLFDKTADLKQLKADIDAALKAKFGNKIPKEWKNPLRDGETKDQPEYQGMVFASFRCYENQKPRVVDAHNQPIAQESGEFYSGCYARVSYKAKGFDTNGSKGVRLELCNIQKVRDGERLDGRTTPEQDFDPVDDTAALF